MKTILVVILVLLCFELYGTDVEATLTYYMYNRDATYVTSRDDVTAMGNSSSGPKVGQNTTFDVIRGYLEFPIPTIGSCASCTLYVYGKTDYSTDDFNTMLYTGSWENTQTTSWELFDGWVSGSAFTGTSLTDGWNSSNFTVGWNTIVFNEAGRDSVLAYSNSTIKIAVISAEDASRSQPTAAESLEFESIAATGKEPFLRIGTTAGYTGTVNGVDEPANISGVLKATVKNVNGVE